MPVRQLKEADGAFEAQLPGQLQRVWLSDLQPGLDSANSYILGLVSQNYPSAKLGTGQTLLKVVLEEPVTEMLYPDIRSINTFFFGQLAEECAIYVRQGDTLAVTGFKCTKSPSVSKDGRHFCQLELLDEIDSTVYVYVRSSSPSTVKAGSSVCVKSHSPSTVQAGSSPSIQKYTYTPLNQLTGGKTVNVFGVVKFFKPPFPSKGTDYCSTITIVDQTDAQLKCMLFSRNKEALPEIYKNGDIVRFHRLKIQEYNKEKQGVANAGFAFVTFDGAPGAPVIARSSSKDFHLTRTDLKMVVALRSWASCPLSESIVKLSDVKCPRYFDLTCQLLGKAKVDMSSFLLKVWDGTKCLVPHTKVLVEDKDSEGDAFLIHQLRDLTVDILVYDNHIQVAKSLMIGSYLRIYSLHANTQTPSNENRSKTPCLEFQLHGGTGYGRGIAVLPEHNYDVKELKKRLDAVNLQHSQDFDFDGSFTGPTKEESLAISSSQRCQQSSATVLTAHQHLKTTSLHSIIEDKAPQKYRICAKLRTFEPQRLNQSVKLHCPTCNSLQEVPDEDDLDLILRKCAANIPNQRLNTALYQSTTWKTENQGGRKIVIHFVKKNEWQNPQDTLIMIEGGTLQEIFKLSGQFDSIIPVICGQEDLCLADLSLPFLIKGNQLHYGCKHCSSLKNMEGIHSLIQEDSWEPAAIAKALGIVPLKYVLIMKFTFDDGTGQLDAYLWHHSEQFFHIRASEVLVDDATQEKLHLVMNKLCPSRRKPKEYPWLECCIKSYNIIHEMEPRVGYQIFDTEFAEDM